MNKRFAYCDRLQTPAAASRLQRRLDGGGERVARWVPGWPLRGRLDKPFLLMD